MKIAISLNEVSGDAHIAEFFGRGEAFLLFNTRSNLKEFISNPYARSVGGAGIETAKLLIEKGINALIVNKIGMNAYVMLSSADVKIYISECVEYEKAIELFIEKKLHEAHLDYIKTK